jgi:hypothetical protein
MDTSHAPEPKPRTRVTLALIRWYSSRFADLLDEAESRGFGIIGARRVALHKLTIELGILPAEERKHVMTAMGLIERRKAPQKVSWIKQEVQQCS